MSYLKKIFKYLICVICTMIGLMLFGFMATEGKSVFPGGDLLYSLPLYFGLGWSIYQAITKKLRREMSNYNWMLIKVSLQAGVIMIGGMFLVLYLESKF